MTNKKERRQLRLSDIRFRLAIKQADRVISELEKLILKRREVANGHTK